MPPNDPQAGETWKRRSDGVLFTVVPREAPTIDGVNIRWVQQEDAQTVEPYVLPFFLRDFEYVSGASDE